MALSHYWIFTVHDRQQEIPTNRDINGRILNISPKEWLAMCLRISRNERTHQYKKKYDAVSSHSVGIHWALFMRALRLSQISWVVWQRCLTLSWLPPVDWMSEGCCSVPGGCTFSSLCDSINKKFYKGVLTGSIGFIWTIGSAGLDGSAKNRMGLFAFSKKTQISINLMVRRGAGSFQVLTTGSFQ